MLTICVLEFCNYGISSCIVFFSKKVTDNVYCNTTIVRLLYPFGFIYTLRIACDYENIKTKSTQKRVFSSVTSRTLRRMRRVRGAVMQFNFFASVAARVDGQRVSFG